MLLFKTPELSDRQSVYQAVNQSSFTGSDASFGNIFLLRKKYGTQIAFFEDLLIRYYNGKGSRRGYTFPLGAEINASPEKIHKALDAIETDAAQNGRPLEFCLATKEQADFILQHFGPQATLEENRGDSDYIYGAETLATLEGKDYRKKRNHLSRFSRTYDNFELRPLTSENISEALDIEKMWLIESGKIEFARTPPNESSKDCPCEDVSAECSEDTRSRCAEFDAIAESLNNLKELGITGAVLYVQGIPAGMTMATEISAGVWDIHFEKVIGEYAENGGYTAINKLFAASLAGARLINREEDINIEGLRKAKLSYYPQTILDKFHITFKSL